MARKAKQQQPPPSPEDNLRTLIREARECIQDLRLAQREATNAVGDLERRLQTDLDKVKARMLDEFDAVVKPFIDERVAVLDKEFADSLKATVSAAEKAVADRLDLLVVRLLRQLREGGAMGVRIPKA